MIIAGIAVLILIGTILYLFIVKREKTIFFLLIILVLVIRLFNILIYRYAVLFKDLNLLKVIGDIRYWSDILLYVVIFVIGVMYIKSLKHTGKN